MAINMVDAVLRIILNHEYRHVLPERTLGKALHHNAKREVVIRLMRGGRATPCGRPIRVVTRQNHHHQVGHRLLGFPFLDVLGKNIGLQHVRDILRPRRIFTHQRAIERRDRRRGVVVLLHKLTEIGGIVRLPIAPLGQVLLPHGDVAILRRRRILAKHTDLFPFGLRAFPQEPTARVGQGVASLGRIRTAIIQRPHWVLGFVCRHEPLVPVRGVAAGGEEMVEQHILIGERVGVRRNIPPVHGERRVTGPLANIAKYLIVGAVFLHDEHHVIDQTRLARTLWYGARTRGRTHGERAVRLRQQGQAIVLGDTRRVGGEFGVRRNRNHVDRTTHRMHKAGRLARVPARASVSRANTKERTHGDRRAVATDVDAGGVPPGRNQPLEHTVLESEGRRHIVHPHRV